MKIFFLLIFKILLNYTCQHSLRILESLDNEYIELELQKTIVFNVNNRNNFIYHYEKNEDLIIFLKIKNSCDDVEVTDVNHNFVDFKEEKDFLILKLNKPGLYYFKFYKSNYDFPITLDNEFTTFLPGHIIDTIDFTEQIYYSSHKFITSKNYNPGIYKVEKLKEDTYAYFINENPYSNPIEICDSQNICNKNITLFQFLKDKEYTIYIHFILRNNLYYYFPLLFFSIEISTIEKKEPGLYVSLEPKIFNIYLKDKGDLYGLHLNCKYFFTSFSDEEITFNNINNLLNMNFSETSETFNINNKYKYLIIMAIPPVISNELKDDSSKVVIANKMITNISNENQTILPYENAFIYKDMWLNSSYSTNYDDQNPLENYNVLRTYSSSENNLVYIMSNTPGYRYDYLIENNYKNPIYINKNNKEIELKVESYYPRYSLFGAMNFELFKTYLSISLMDSKENKISEDKKNWPKISFDNQYLPMNIRVSSNLNEFFEFFNFYSEDFEENVNIYIDKIYGESDIYECSSDSIDIKNLSFLTTPITNCTNKQNIFNRLFSFKGNKLISGYLSPNSYFDIYLEYNNEESNSIKISPLLNSTVDSASQYIKENKEYQIDFIMDHMVKIYPKNNIEVTIYNDDNIIKLNSDEPTAQIVGNNYKLKSNIDTMIYFYGKILSLVKQIRLDPQQKGKNLKIKSNEDVVMCIDSGFSGYNPLNIDMISQKANYRNMYIENPYEKMKNKLVKNENIYLFYGSKNIKNAMVKIEYINENLNHPNNEYTFNFIPKDSSEKSLIIFNRNINEIVLGVHFCNEPNLVKMYYQGINSQKESILEFNKTDIYIKQKIDEFGVKYRFDAKEDFIFSYSFYDKTDNDYEKTNWFEERKELNNLTINNITEKNSDNNTLLINFHSNYINSTTKYIIIISSEEEDKTMDNFNNPCYITKLATERPDKIIVENFFYAGENESITAEVDIDNIINDKNKYIINIISQELRFSKKLNFYIPKNFYYKGKMKINKNNDDNDKTSIIVLSILGIALIIILILIVYFYKRNKIKNNSFEINSEVIEKQKNI